jgi:hypothetical protein
MRQFISAIATAFAVSLLWLPAAAMAADTLDLQIRRQVRNNSGVDGWKAEESAEKWDAGDTAVIVCDMWDAHWCRGATARVAEMARW